MHTSRPRRGVMALHLFEHEDGENEIPLQDVQQALQ